MPESTTRPLSRRLFLERLGLAGSLLLTEELSVQSKGSARDLSSRALDDLVAKGNGKEALAFRHFPSRLHAFVWRNWTVVPMERMAQVVNAKQSDLVRLGRAMGLPDPPPVSLGQLRRSYITIIRRNWHLLPSEQLIELLGWTPERFAFTLREDDFLLEKLGGFKPVCDRLSYSPPALAMQEREGRIASLIEQEFPGGLGRRGDPLFGFVRVLAREPGGPEPHLRENRLSPRFCYSYFALYGDPLLEKEADPYPEGYLKKLAASGVDGVWLQAVLHKLTPFPWDLKMSARHAERLRSLRQLTKRARRAGVKVYLYLNEPRAMPLRFFDRYAELKGVVEGDHAALCTSHPAVQEWLVSSVAQICRDVPELGGFFTITASENLSNCWSHHGGAKCTRCGQRSPSDVIAEINGLVWRGIQQAGRPARLLVWDWGWAEEWSESIIRQLPRETALMSVSEWDIPIRRGGIENRVGEYSISTIGPGARAKRHWSVARECGLRTVAKIQAGNTWELSAVPYIPALENVGQHAAHLIRAKVDGLMLGWTLGGYPSPNLELVAEVAELVQATPPSAGEGLPDDSELVSEAMRRVAQRRFGERMAAPVVSAWRQFSSAFREFPFDGGVVYNAPMQFGPSNLLWEQPSGYRATMVGFPYDDLDAWRGPYPPDVFISQFEKVANGFASAIAGLETAFVTGQGRSRSVEEKNLQDELNVANAAAIHFRSTANQARFIQLRRVLSKPATQVERAGARAQIRSILTEEIRLAGRLYALQCADSRLGFEASNQYYYVPLDLVEKVLNCHDLLERWLG
jgi:hypothetical protein